MFIQKCATLAKSFPSKQMRKAKLHENGSVPHFTVEDVVGSERAWKVLGPETKLYFSES